MVPQDIIDVDGNFNWPYLKGCDLTYPAPDNYRVTHVYQKGAVVLQGASDLDIHNLCVSLNIKFEDSVPVPHRDVTLLTERKYLVEQDVRDAEFLAARTAHHAEMSRRHELFKQALIAREGLGDNPKAELCYSKAHERSHSQGLPAVVTTFIDLAELIR